jgi:hypothetical protein
VFENAGGAENGNFANIFKEIGLAAFISLNPPAADEGLIPRPLGRLKFSD